MKAKSIDTEPSVWGLACDSSLLPAVRGTVQGTARGEEDTVYLCIALLWMVLFSYTHHTGHKISLADLFHFSLTHRK